MPVFTPLDRAGNRLRFSLSEVEVLAGSLERGPRPRPPAGTVQACVQIAGTIYNVFSRECALEGCLCDTVIAPMWDGGVPPAICYGDAFAFFENEAPRLT
jgi:hypothetical protein